MFRAPDGLTILQSGRTTASCETRARAPDGARVAFTLERQGQLRQIGVMDATGESEEPLTVHGGAYPSWSPEGTWIVYARENGNSSAPEDGVLWVIEVETGVQRQLTQKSER